MGVAAGSDWFVSFDWLKNVRRGLAAKILARVWANDYNSGEFNARPGSERPRSSSRRLNAGSPHYPGKVTMSDASDSSPQAGLSRRGFLKGLGVGTVTTGLASTVAPMAGAAIVDPRVKGPGEIPLELKINGKVRKLNVEPRVTLLDALRNRLDLTGAKKVCDRGTCGACTVLVDGEPVYSCSMLALEAEGRSITTVEGLGTPDRMHAVQQAFVRHDAQQCGFCTPGFVVACAALLKKNKKPGRDEIRLGLGGNLCRCGTYAGIMDVVTGASAKGGAA
jgi:xanthine dehydrogenase YagT iron-sulfur-binding subunit